MTPESHELGNVCDDLKVACVLRCPECNAPLELGHDCLAEPHDGAIWQNNEMAILAADLERIARAFGQACMNLAVLRPSGRDTSLGEDAEAWQEALINGLGSPW